MIQFDVHNLAQIPELDGDFVKFIFMIIVGSIVGIGSLISAAKKKQQEQAERQTHRENWEQIEQEMKQRAAMATRALSQGAYPPPPPPPRAAAPYPVAVPPPPPPVFAPTRSIEGPYIPPRPPARRPSPPRAATVPPAPTRTGPPPLRPQTRRPKKQKAPGIPPAPLLAAPGAGRGVDLSTTGRAPDAPPAPRPAAPASGANAAALSRWLTPDTLRAQFILTEILRPPVGLRDPAGPEL